MWAHLRQQGRANTLYGIQLLDTEQVAALRSELNNTFGNGRTDAWQCVQLGGGSPVQIQGLSLCRCTRPVVDHDRASLALWRPFW
jgi:hypothetical protein